MIKTIYITLGKSCNLHCIYCSQEHVKYTATNINANIYKEISTIKNDLTIVFFGGEPLVYFKEIIEIVNTLNQTKKNIKFSLITNAVLLSTEIVTFCNTNNIAVTISYDGYVQDTTRGFNPLKAKSEEIIALSSVSLSCVISNMNVDIYAIWEDLKLFEIETGKYLPVYFEFIKNFDNNLPDTLCITKNKELEESLDKVFETFVREISNQNYNTREWEFLSSYLKSIKFRSTLSTIEPSCLVGHSVAHIDLDGNLYACHDATECLGNIDTIGLRVGKRITLPISCKECRYLNFCGGGCILLEGRGKLEECYIKTLIYKRIEKLLTYLQYRPDLLLI